MRQIAIIGLGPSQKDAPVYSSYWEKWGLPWDGNFGAYDRGFEMHDRALWETRNVNYLDRLRDSAVPVYMQTSHSDIPASVAYPLKDVVAVTGDYFGSSAAYMIGMAIIEKPARIGVWGIDLVDCYDHQRPNFEYLLGLARGLGIDVYVHPESSLLRLRLEDTFNGKTVAYPVRYGQEAA